MNRIPLVVISAFCLVGALLVLRSVVTPAGSRQPVSSKPPLPDQKQQHTDPNQQLQERAQARVAPVRAIDPNNLAAITRKIAVEPSYTGSARHYYLLLFDEDEAKQVWVAFDDECLYVDCNMNGDLTDSGEAFPANPEDAGSMFRVIKDIGFAMPDGKAASLTYTFSDAKYETFEVRLQVNYRGATFAAWGDHTGEVADVSQVASAPILRVNGPLQMGFEVQARYAIESKRGDTFEVKTGVGTPGLGKGTFVHLKYWNGAIPSNLFPDAEIQFPAEDKGSPSIVVKTKLTQRC